MYYISSPTISASTKFQLILKQSISETRNKLILNVHLDITVIADTAMVIATLQCDYYHYVICYIGSVVIVVPLWLKHRFCVAVLPCKRGNSYIICTLVIKDFVYLTKTTLFS